MPTRPAAKALPVPKGGNDAPRSRQILALAALFALAGCTDVTAPAPPSGDLAGLQRPASPNTALAAPAGFVPPPDTPTRRYPVTPDTLYTAVRSVVAARPRTTELATDPARRRADYVERSLVFRFQDIVSVQVLPAGTDSELVVYSRSITGYSDFGVNKRRVAAILAALDQALPH